MNFIIYTCKLFIELGTMDLLNESLSFSEYYYCRLIVFILFIFLYGTFFFTVEFIYTLY
jgi:hypothetical protein